jgi:hypothetical protein
MTAVMYGDLFATINRFRVGDFSVTTVRDGTVLPDTVHPPFCLDLDDGKIATLGPANPVPAGSFEHPFVPTLANTGKNLCFSTLALTGEALTQIQVRYAPGWQRPVTHRRMLTWSFLPMFTQITFWA